MSTSAKRFAIIQMAPSPRGARACSIVLQSMTCVIPDLLVVDAHPIGRREM